MSPRPQAGRGQSGCKCRLSSITTPCASRVGGMEALRAETFSERMEAAMIPLGPPTLGQHESVQS